MSSVAVAVLVTPLIAWLATVLAERMRSTAGIVVVPGAAQLVMHLLLGGLGPHSTHEMSGPAVPGGDLVIAGVHAGATVLTAAARRTTSEPHLSLFLNAFEESDSCR